MFIINPRMSDRSAGCADNDSADRRPVSGPPSISAITFSRRFMRHVKSIIHRRHGTNITRRRRCGVVLKLATSRVASLLQKLRRLFVQVTYVTNEDDLPKHRVAAVGDFVTLCASEMPVPLMALRLTDRRFVMVAFYFSEERHFGRRDGSERSCASRPITDAKSAACSFHAADFTEDEA